MENLYSWLIAAAIVLFFVVRYLIGHRKREKAAIAWSEAMTLNTAKYPGQAWDDMRRLFTDTEIVEISMAAAMFNMINRLNDSFWTELESVEYNRKQGDAVKGRSVEQIEEYAGRFAMTGKTERASAEATAAP